MNPKKFIHAREEFWKDKARRIEAGLEVSTFAPPENRINRKLNRPFIHSEEGTSGLTGVFEDDGDTGYLYLYEPDGRGVFRYLQVYTTAPKLLVKEQDCWVAWSSDGLKCGVVIWGQLRGIIHVNREIEERAFLTGRDTPGIWQEEALAGFERYFKKQSLQDGET